MVTENAGASGSILRIGVHSYPQIIDRVVTDKPIILLYEII
jgi:hypothetical protein